MTKLKVVPLFFCIGICFLAAGIGSVFTTGAINTWYVTLNKPFFSPPNWIFGPVWTVLYLLMGIALYIYWDSKGNVKKKRSGLGLFGVQLALNALWSLLFFGLKSPTAAFVGIIFLWLTILLTINTFTKLSKVAGSLLIPYLTWVSFATFLNLFIILLNP